MRSDRERLEDILGAIAQIEEYTFEGKSGFERERLIQDGVIHQIVIIGEAVRAISPVLEMGRVSGTSQALRAFRRWVRERVNE